MEANPYGWWKLNGGKVDFDYTGLAANEYGWWYIHEGMVDFDHFGLEQNEYGWFRIESGKVNFDFNGLAANEYGWWYLHGGRYARRMYHLIWCSRPVAIYTLLVLLQKQLTVQALEIISPSTMETV